YFSLDEKTGQQDRAHHCGTNTRDVQTRDGGVKKQKWNNNRRRPFSRQPSDHRQGPKQARHDSDVQTSHREEVKRACLLKRFFDVLWSLMAQAQRDDAQKILHLGRIIQTAADRALHPSARALRRAQDRTTSAFAEQNTVFWITNKQTAAGIQAREIRAHVELAGIARQRDRFGDSEKFQFVAKF